MHCRLQQDKPSKRLGVEGHCVFKDIVGVQLFEDDGST
jgi:hypothetical protein